MSSAIRTVTSIARVVASLLLLASSASAQAGDCPPGMEEIKGGTQRVGKHKIDVKSFCFDRTEVTVDAYAACAKIGVCASEGLECGNGATWNKKGHGSHPVNCVTWDEADNFCRAHGKRLPTEQEFEWAARGGERGRTYPWGEEPPQDRACWDGAGNALGAGERKEPCRVGSNPRADSADGLADLAGNVREWTSSKHGRFRILRGGSWGDSLASFLSASFRGWNAPDERMELLGFRCAAEVGAVARTPTPPPPKPPPKLQPGDVLVLDPFGVGHN